MSSLKIRQIPFNFDEVEFIWNRSNPAYSVLANCGSFFVLGLERFLVRVMKDAEPLITDESVRHEAHLFMQQEAVHSKAHRRHVKALVNQFPGLQVAADVAVSHYDALYDSRDLRYHLAYAAGLEGTFTPLFRTVIDRREALFAGGDARVASLFLWHFCEEIEHRSSAVNVFEHVVGDRGYKLRSFPSVLRHANRCFAEILTTVRAQVPEQMAEVDSLLPLGQRIGGIGSNPLPGVPLLDQFLVGLRAAMSVRSGYDHLHQPLPAWAATWFEHYERGEDMTNFYGRPPEAHPIDSQAL